MAGSIYSLSGRYPGYAIGGIPEPFGHAKERKAILSVEEIINAWKNNEDDADQLLKDKKLKDKLKQDGKTPANPAGEQEITDEELKAVEGGKLVALTCNVNSC